MIPESALSSLYLILTPMLAPSRQFVCFAPSLHAPEMDLDGERSLFVVAHDLGYAGPLYERIVALTRRTFSREIGDFVAAGKARLRKPIDPVAEALWARVASTIDARATCWRATPLRGSRRTANPPTLP